MAAGGRGAAVGGRAHREHNVAGTRPAHCQTASPCRGWGGMHTQGSLTDLHIQTLAANQRTSCRPEAFRRSSNDVNGVTFSKNKIILV